jgi:outer membrane protein assembly factor BamB
MRGEYSKLAMPVTVLPGIFGGVFGPPSVGGSLLFAPVVNAATRLVNQEEGRRIGRTSGELVALNLATGSVKWRRRYPTAPYGGTTTVNDLVFATTFDGTVRAYYAKSGREVWTSSLSAGINAGMAVSGDFLLTPAGLPSEGGDPKLVAYRLSG